MEKLQRQIQDSLRILVYSQRIHNEINELNVNQYIYCKYVNYVVIIIFRKVKGHTSIQKTLKSRDTGVFKHVQRKTKNGRPLVVHRHIYVSK